MKYIEGITFVAVLLVSTASISVVCAHRAGHVLPLPGPSDAFALDDPICTSQNTLCRISFNISSGDHYLTSSDDNKLCNCPDGLSCPAEWGDTDRSLVHFFKGENHQLFMKLDFCQLSLPERVCEKDEVVVTLKGFGFIMTNIHTPFRCRCNRVLYENRSWDDNMSTFIEYTCGKPRCHVMMNLVDSPRMPCMRIRNVGDAEALGPRYSHEYLCRCRHSERCTPDLLPATPGDQTLVYCRPAPKKRPPGAFRVRRWN